DPMRARWASLSPRAASRRCTIRWSVPCDAPASRAPPSTPPQNVYRTVNDGVKSSVTSFAAAHARANALVPPASSVATTSVGTTPATPPRPRKAGVLGAHERASQHQRGGPATPHEVAEPELQERQVAGDRDDGKRDHGQRRRFGGDARQHDRRPGQPAVAEEVV